MTHAYRTFFENGIDLPKKRRSKMTNRCKEELAKTVRFVNATSEQRKGILEGRVKEWEMRKWFNAAILLSIFEGSRLVAEGRQTHRYALGRHEQEREVQRAGKPGRASPQQGKLVVRGGQEDSNPGVICSADIPNAYFQGHEMHRVLLLHKPREGLALGLNVKWLLLARVPVYGAHDSVNFGKDCARPCTQRARGESQKQCVVYSDERR